MMLAPLPRAEPANYHRAINGLWWAAALVAGALAWVALLA